MLPRKTIISIFQPFSGTTLLILMQLTTFSSSTSFPLCSLSIRSNAMELEWLSNTQQWTNTCRLWLLQTLHILSIREISFLTCKMCHARRTISRVGGAGGLITGMDIILQGLCWSSKSEICWHLYALLRNSMLLSKLHRTLYWVMAKVKNL